MAELLSLANVTAGYGDSVILEDVSLPGRGRQLRCSGATAWADHAAVTLMGFTTVRRGTLSWRGRDIKALPTWRRAQAGLGWVPQERLMFASLSVEEHLTRSRVRTLGRRRSGLFPRLEDASAISAASSPGRAADARDPAR